MECDHTSHAAYIQVVSLTQLTCTFTPARFGALSKAFGWCWCCAWIVVHCSSQYLSSEPSQLFPTLPGSSGSGDTCQVCSQQHRVTATAAAPVGGRGSSLPALPSPPQHTEIMSAELDNLCPICLDSWEEASYVMPCCHRFCFTCIQRWTESKPECPLCKGSVNSVQANDDFEELLSDYLRRHQSSSTRPPTALQHPHHRLLDRCPGLQWAASSLTPRQPSSGSTQLSSSLCCPGCTSCWG
nr:E3 ubiquitin-protein ligase Topors-like [Columba livia]